MTASVAGGVNATAAGVVGAAMIAGGFVAVARVVFAVAVEVRDGVAVTGAGALAASA